jgi:hypothetical protein
MNKFHIVPNVFKNKIGDDTNSQVSINFDSTRKELIEFDRDVVVDLKKLYSQEKTNSFKVRPTFKINYLYDNFYSGTTNSKYKSQLIYNINNKTSTSISNVDKGFLPSYEFDFFRPNVVNSFGYETINAFKYNWDYYITYPYTGDSKQNLNVKIGDRFYDWVAEDGIPFVTDLVVQGGFDIVRINCALPHNVNEGESIIVKIDSVSRAYEIFSFGDGTVGSENFVLNILNIDNNISDNKLGALKRVLFIENSGETVSSYYVRKHKVISNSDKIAITKSGFETNAYDEPKVLSFIGDKFSYVKKTSNISYNFTLTDDVSIDDLIDNQNRPLTELYLTAIYKGYSGFFDVIKKGWLFNITEPTNSWWDNSTLNSNVDITVENYFDEKQNNFKYFKLLSDIIDGDFCEYNAYNQEEIIISELYHKIKHSESVFRVSNYDNNKSGYYYKPHNKLQLKVFSDYIETVDKQFAYDVPNYAFYSQQDGQFRWRDIYSVGFFDENNNGVNYPFVNGSFYPFVNNVLKLFPEGYDYYEQVVTKSRRIIIGSTGVGSLIKKPVIDECE